MFRFRLRSLMLVVAVACLAMGAVRHWMEVEARRERARRLIDLLQLGIALHCYQDSYGSLPPATYRDEDGEPTVSWRAGVLPYLENGSRLIPVRKDRPWTAAENFDFRRWFFDWPVMRDREQGSETRYVAVVGADTGFGSKQSCAIREMRPDTILVVEMADSGIHWLSPGDLDLEEIEAGPEATVGDVLGDVPGGVRVLCADGWAGTVSTRTPFAQLKPFFSRQGPRPMTRAELFGWHEEGGWPLFLACLAASVALFGLPFVVARWLPVE